MNKPKVIEVFGVKMANIPYVMKELKIPTRYGVAPKMKTLKIKGKKIGRNMFFPFVQIQAALLAKEGDEQ